LGETYAVLNSVKYPVASDKEGLLWRVADVGGPVTETWDDWSGGMGETERRSKRGYFLSDGFDASSGVLRFCPHLKRLNNPILSQNHGYFFEGLGAAGTVTFDAGTTATVTAVSTKTFAHTVASQANRVLMVTSQTASGGISTATYAGKAMTKLTSGGAAGARVGIFYLIDPPAGANNVVIKFNGTVTGHASASSFYNVSQTSPFRDTATITGTGTTASRTVVSATGDLVFDAVCVDTTNALTVGAGQTQNWTNAANTVRGGSSRENGAASVTMSWTWTGSSLYGIIAVPIKPVTTPYIYCADGDVIHKMTYDSDVGVSPVVINSGTATAGAASTLTDSGAAFGTLTNYHVRITGGTGSGQWRRISSNTATVLTITPNWETNPSTDSTYQVVVSVYVASAAFGRPAFFLSKWYVPAGASVNVRRLDAIGSTTDTWADSGFVSLHLTTFQKGNTPHIAGATTVNQIGTSATAPTSALTSLGAGVGDTSTTITDLKETQGYVFVSKEDGLYEFDTNGVARPVLGGLSRANVDNQNGRHSLTAEDMAFYPSKSGLQRYLIGSGARPVGIETIKSFRRVENTGIMPPKDRRPSWVIRSGGYLYTAYNDASAKSLLCQAELGEEPLNWHSFRDTDLTKGAFVDSLNHIWMKGAASDIDVRDIMVFELAPDGSLDTQFRKGTISETYTLIGDEWTPNNGEQVQMRTFEIELAGGWDAQTSLALQVYRDNGNSAEAVGSAITAAGVTIKNWTTGTTDTAYRVRPILEVTTGASYTPLTVDPTALRYRLKGRKPMIYRVVIPADREILAGYVLTPDTVRENLYRLQDQGVIAIQEPGQTATFQVKSSAQWTPGL